MTAISDSLGTSATTARRRSAVIAASSGLVVTMGLPAAATPMVDAAAEATDTTSTQAVEAVPAEPVVTTTDVVSVPQEAQVDFALAPLTNVDSSAAEAEAARVDAEAAALAERQASAERASRAGAGRAGANRVNADDAGADLAGATEAVAVSGGGGGAAIDIGSRYIGTPYVYGGTSPSGFDCSGFVQYVYAQMGVSLPRTASQQQGAGAKVSASQAQPGDIVSFTGSGGVYHNGIYAGNGKMLDSPRSGKSLALRDVWSSSVTFTRVG